MQVIFYDMPQAPEPEPAPILDDGERATLERIFINLCSGAVYGEDIENVRFPYFHTVISYDVMKDLFFWTHYGSSANRATLEELEWIITRIFKTTPSGFLKRYRLEM